MAEQPPPSRRTQGPAASAGPTHRHAEPAASALARVPLFQGLDPALLRELDAACERITLRGGSELFHQGEPADALYVLLNGRLEIISEPEPGRRLLVGELGRGACVGEMSLLTGAPRSASVRAIRDSEVLCISREDFMRFLSANPLVGIELARTLARRLAETTAAMARSGPERVATIAIVPAVADDMPPGFVPALLDCFLQAGRTARRLHRRAVEEQLGSGICEAELDSAAGGALVRWLGEQEEASEFVLYEGDARQDAWTDRCLRQADHVLLVARADADPARVPASLWATLGSNACASTRKEVVLLHEADRPPRGSSAWRNGRPVNGLHHVRLSVNKDYQRVVRTLTGRGVSLVLSGGGARGFAHIGVLKALQESGLPVDAVCGTSMGSIIGAQAALEWTPAEMVERNRRGFGSMAGVRVLRDCTFPFVSLLTSSVTVRMLREMFGEREIDDLWLPFFCVTANLSRAQAVVHDSGPLWFWVKASCAVPGIQAPSFHDGDVHVDGGLLNNVPADIMRGRRSGTVVAVDVNPPLEFAAPAGARAVLTGREVLRNRLGPAKGRAALPGIFRLLSRSVGLSSLQNRGRISEYADLSLYPPLQDVDPFDWRAVATAAERGYHYALPRIAAWQAART